MDNRLARGHAQRAALEGEILYGYRDVLSLKRSEGQGDRVRRAGLRAVLLEAIRIPLDVAKLEGVKERFRGRNLLVNSLVEQ